MVYGDAAKSRELGFSGGVRAQCTFPSTQVHNVTSLPIIFDLFEALENPRSLSFDSFEAAR
jgi:hypothetical protein